MKQNKEQNNRLPIFRERLLSILGDMTTKDFAEKVGISRQSMGFYLSGKRVPDSVTLTQICQKCKVSSDWLLGLTDTKSPDTDIAAVIQYTGLTEDNVNALHDLSQVQELPLSTYRQTRFALIHDLVDIGQMFNVYAPFFKMQRLRESFDGKVARVADDGIDQLIAEGHALKRGYAVLSANESISFYASQIANSIEQAIIDRYSLAETSEPSGTCEAVEVNGKPVMFWKE